MRDPERVRAAKARWRDANREKLRADNRKRYAEKKELILRQTREWQIANPDRVAEIQRNWRIRHREQVLDKNRRRRAAKKGAQSENYTRAEIYERDGGCCRYCTKRVPLNGWHLAHLVALAAGGSDTPGNVAVSCAECNLRDGTGRLPVQLHIAA